MARFFTSDWHLNESRITESYNPFFRPFASIEEQNNKIIYECNQMVGEDDHLYHLGDVAMDEDGIRMLDRIKCKNRTLFIGNYDEDKIDLLAKYFDRIYTNAMVYINDDELAHCNHYPVNAVSNMFNLVGHIHGLWKVRPNMINVSVDAWNYQPLSCQNLAFVKNAMENHYDNNVFTDLKP